MGKSTHFIGQPILGQLLNFLEKEKIIKISRENGGERYVKKFNAWCHLTIMLYAVIMRFDSLREITSATMMECRKLGHLGIKDLPRRSTLADATLIANLLLMLLQKSTTRSWSFSGLATMVRIMLMYYIDVHGFLEHPEKDWEEALEKAL